MLTPEERVLECCEKLARVVKRKEAQWRQEHPEAYKAIQRRYSEKRKGARRSGKAGAGRV